LKQTKRNINVLITGAHGQLGWELTRTAAQGIHVHAVDIDELDITQSEHVNRHVDTYKPDWIINAAAYTAVDKAEQDSALAYKVNRDGATNLSQAAKKNKTKLIQVSTDFVFDGNKSSPYLPKDITNPLCVYGASKQAGDDAVLEILGQQATIIRTAWVYSSHGNNFVKTMLKLMSEREQLGIVTDQVGTPTWANGLAKAIWKVIELSNDSTVESQATNINSRIYHYTDGGVASWYDFAEAIQEEAINLGLLSPDNICQVQPIRTEDYPQPAQRPSYSVMDKTNTSQVLKIPLLHWRKSLRSMLAELA